MTITDDGQISSDLSVNYPLCMCIGERGLKYSLFTCSICLTTCIDSHAGLEKGITEMKSSMHQLA